MGSTCLHVLLCAFLMHAVQAQPCAYTSCECEHIAGRPIIVCSGPEYSDVPASQPTNTHYDELIMSGTSILHLKDGVFKNVPVRKLDLSKNRIETVSVKAFDGLEESLEELLLGLAMFKFPSAAIAQLKNLKVLAVTGYHQPALPSLALNTLSQLHTLSLEEGELKELSATDLRAQTSSLTSLSLRFNKLEAVPTEALESLNNLATLNLAENQIAVIQARAFRGITSLDLAQNSISELHDDSLADSATTLQVLRLKLCNLQMHQLAAISKLSQLRELHMSLNKLGGIPDGLFANMKQLHTVDVSVNSIRKITEAMLRGLSALKVLKLQENKVTQIETGSFSYLRSLEELYLDNQGVSSALTDKDVFTGIENSLTHLSLKNIGFSAANWEALTGFTNLENIVLAENSISNIPQGAFTQWRKLQVLDLSTNMISHLGTQGTFAGLEKTLQKIKLNGNTLTTINKCTFFEFGALNRIDLTNNPLQCDCRLRWLFQWFQQHYPNEFDRDVVSWKCQDKEHKDKWFRKLTLDEFICVPAIKDHDCVRSTLAPPMTTTAEMGRDSLWLNVTEVTDVSMYIHWKVRSSSGDSPDGFILSYRVIGGGSMPLEQHLRADTRSLRLTELTPGKTYYVCINAKYQKSGRNPGATCLDVTMRPIPTASPSANKAGPSDLQIALGSTFGVILCLLVIALVVLCIRRHRRDKMTGLAGRLRLGYDSRRFSRPSTVNSQVNMDTVDNQTFVKKLDRFSVDERDRILDMLTSNGRGVSTVSTDSEVRYVPDLPPRNLGYMQEVSLQDEEPQEHLYSEIPGEGVSHI